jgi:hypothetical protein
LSNLPSNGLEVVSQLMMGIYLTLRPDEHQKLVNELHPGAEKIVKELHGLHDDFINGNLKILSLD